MRKLFRDLKNGDIVTTCSGADNLLPSNVLSAYLENQEKPTHICPGDIFTIVDRAKGLLDEYDNSYMTILCDGELAELHKNRVTTLHFVKI